MRKVLVCIVFIAVIVLEKFGNLAASSSDEVAFQPNLSSLAIRSFGVPKEDDKRSSDVNPSSSAAIIPTLSPATSSREDAEEVHNLVTRTEGDYIEPWVTRIYLHIEMDILSQFFL